MQKIADVLKDYVDMTIKKIVDNPQEVLIETFVSTKSVVIKIKADQTDYGKIIGKRGRTIESIKVLCLAIKNTLFPDDSRIVLLEILEDENSTFCFKSNGGSIKNVN